MNPNSPTVPQLSVDFLKRPIAHRGLHDKRAGIPENSLAAFQAAIDRGYGIELDLQVTGDERAVVFHDYRLGRLTPERGRVRDLSLERLASISLKGNEAQKIPSLKQVFDQVNGRVPILIEIKDQDGKMGKNIGAIERDIATDIAAYSGHVAVMSFNPHSILAMKELAPNVPRGLTTYAWNDSDADGISAADLRSLYEIEMFEKAGCSFISHSVKDLDNPHVSALKKRGVPVLCWTVKSAKSDIRARRVADNVTFEGYLPA
ncbi:glycerophosphodiester phosphodiesterase family protein [Halocynthiibacter sp. C4]|uniref:glycerophosphodiester phosphodiesterase family protein n=1 Tax=Halocynthiibacter sp. C4 TaxID=2992758 RepID=UPI00237B0907|nr:glycerophosphodiester phosphodiesterase family protein [Halocynthiibacter sp. C4]MDE0588401.1 glycerophosphodiester phosphodiesterase family protein [Halocynthiibacter sp. C4]